MINDDILAFLYYIETQIGEIVRPGWSEPFPRLLPSERQQTDVRWSAASSKQQRQQRIRNAKDTNLGRWVEDKQVASREAARQSFPGL